MPYSKPLIFLLNFLLIAHPSFSSSLAGQSSLTVKTLAIAEFRNNTGRQELEYMKQSIPAIMTTDLSNTGLLNILERMEINRILEEHKLSISGAVDERTAKEAGKLLGADYMITGSFTKLGSDIRVDVKLIDTGSGSITGFSQTGNDENVIHRLSESLTKNLTGKEIPLLVKSPRYLVTEDAMTQLAALDQPWYKRWYVWGILVGIIAGVIAASSGAGGGKGGAGGSGGGGGGGGG